MKNGVSILLGVLLILAMLGLAWVGYAYMSASSAASSAAAEAKRLAAKAKKAAEGNPITDTIGDAGDLVSDIIGLFTKGKK